MVADGAYVHFAVTYITCDFTRKPSNYSSTVPKLILPQKEKYILKKKL